MGTRDPEYRQLLVVLRKAREDAGLTQEEVCHLLKRPRSFTSKCETGERRIDAIELKQFAELYGKVGLFFGKRLLRALAAVGPVRTSSLKKRRHRHGRARR